MLPTKIVQAIEKSWSCKTCYPWDNEKWSKENPSLWQCAVTALLVQDLYWWKIAFNKSFNHYWNTFDDGNEIDLTRNQFPEISHIKIQELVDRESLLHSQWSIIAKTLERYNLLSQEFNKNNS